MRPTKQIEADLTTYYDAESQHRADHPLGEMRKANRKLAITRLLSPLDRPLLDLGMGPAKEGVAFKNAGFGVVGLDLSIENCRHGTTVGLPSVQGTARQLPFTNGSIADVWSMSVLMHLNDEAVGQALSELRRVLRSSGLLICGTWGGADSFDLLEGRFGPARVFFHRSDDRWQWLIKEHFGVVEEFTIQRPLPDLDWHYQFCVARAP